MLDLLTKENFEKHLHTTFHIQFKPDVNMEAELVDVKALGGDSDLARQPFSIILRTAQEGQYYTQATFIVSHPEMGEFPLFLAPKGPDGKGMTYESIFS